MHTGGAPCGVSAATVAPLRSSQFVIVPIINDGNLSLSQSNLLHPFILRGGQLPTLPTLEASRLFKRGGKQKRPTQESNFPPSVGRSFQFVTCFGLPRFCEAYRPNFRFRNARVIPQFLGLCGEA